MERFEMILYFLPGFIIGLTVHESAHAIVSKWLGDRLAESRGRISLNPMRHLSPLGTVMLFLAGFGWGRPVPVNLYHYKRPKLYYLFSSLAGPVSNLILCALCLAAMYFLVWVGGRQYAAENLWAWNAIGITLKLLMSAVYINLILAVINLIPIPPLDGSKIWPCIIPGMRPTWTGNMTWVWIIVLVILMKSNATSYIINPAAQLMSKMIPHFVATQEQEMELPDGFPVELQAPQGAYYIDYIDKTKPGVRKKELESFFMLDESYPAVEFRNQLGETLRGYGWSEYGSSMVRDPNEWKTSGVLGSKNYHYKTRSFSESWKKDNKKTLRVKMTYIVDPNTLMPEEQMSVSCTYTQQ